MNQQRLDRLTELTLAHGLEGIALMPGPNMLYIAGIHAHISERPMLLFLPVDDEPAMIIPRLEAMKAEKAGIPSDRIFAWSDEEGYTGAFQQACAQLELADYLLGVESLHMRVLELELLQRYAPGLTTAHAEPVMEALRIIKDKSELQAMARAAAVAERAMNQLLPRIQIGQTEKKLAAMLTQELLLAGADALSFPPIVAAGRNSASPHATPTGRPIQAGDLLLFDWGAVVDDYPSDITRTFAVGEIGPALEEIYRLVLAANEAARAQSAPGATCHEIDAAARSLITEAGYGDAFIHRTGHGLGLEIHEPPYIRYGNDRPLAEGMVFTIEPGIYLPDQGGVRIEDNVVVTAQGCRSLTSFSRELRQVG